MSDDPVFAIEFTAEGVQAAFVSPDGRERDLAGFALVDFQAEAEKSPANALDKLIGLLAAKARTGGRIRAAVLSMPCDLDAARTRVVRYPQAPWLDGQPLPAMLGDILGVPVVMERRAALMLAYDRAMLGLPEPCLAIGCYIDTHYNTAVWHNGSLLAGKNGRAGTIGHMTIHGREDVCFCGKAGCVDLYGAGLRLEQLHAMIFPDTPKEELFSHHGEHPLILDYLRMMAYPVAMEVNIIDPDFLVLGGQIPAMPGFPTGVLRGAILEHAYRPEAGDGSGFAVESSVSALPILSSVASMTPGVVCAAQYALGKVKP